MAYAAKNYGCDVTGLTLAQTGAKFGNERIKANGVSENQARILCLDYRDMPKEKKFNKIVSLEMAEVSYEAFQVIPFLTLSFFLTARRCSPLLRLLEASL